MGALALFLGYGTKFCAQVVEKPPKAFVLKAHTKRVVDQGREPTAPRDFPRLFQGPVVVTAAYFGDDYAGWVP